MLDCCLNTIHTNNIWSSEHFCYGCLSYFVWVWFVNIHQHNRNYDQSYTYFVKSEQEWETTIHRDSMSINNIFYFNDSVAHSYVIRWIVCLCDHFEAACYLNGATEKKKHQPLVPDFVYTNHWIEGMWQLNHLRGWSVKSHSYYEVLNNNDKWLHIWMVQVSLCICHASICALFEKNAHGTCSCVVCAWSHTVCAHAHFIDSFSRRFRWDSVFVERWIHITSGTWLNHSKSQLLLHSFEKRNETVFFVCSNETVYIQLTAMTCTTNRSMPEWEKKNTWKRKL